MIAKFVYGAPMLNEGIKDSCFFFFLAQFCASSVSSAVCIMHYLVFRLSKSHVLVSGLEGSVVEVFVLLSYDA